MACDHPASSSSPLTCIHQLYLQCIYSHCHFGFPCCSVSSSRTSVHHLLTFIHLPHHLLSTLASLWTHSILPVKCPVFIYCTFFTSFSPLKTLLHHRICNQPFTHIHTLTVQQSGVQCLVQGHFDTSNAESGNKPRFKGLFLYKCKQPVTFERDQTKHLALQANI